MLIGSIKRLVCYSSSVCSADISSRYEHAITKSNLGLQSSICSNRGSELSTIGQISEKHRQPEGNTDGLDNNKKKTSLHLVEPLLRVEGLKRAIHLSRSRIVDISPSQSFPILFKIFCVSSFQAGRALLWVCFRMFWIARPFWGISRTSFLNVLRSSLLC